MKRTQKHPKTLHTLLLYTAGFCLFLEWLYPLSDLSETNIGVFILFAFYCFLISYFQWHWLITMTAKAFGLMLIVNHLYLESAFIDIVWINDALQEIIYNVELMFAGQWYLLTMLFRSLLFLVLIWLMSYLLYYWFVRMKNIFLFILLTFIYIGILDTFTVYEGSMAMVRIFVISFIALGMSSLSKEIENNEVSVTLWQRFLYWLLPLMFAVAAVTWIGYLAPKSEPQWEDPVPFLQSAADYTGLGDSVSRRVGYGEDDTQLGGSFMQDDTVLFHAKVEEDHYWRIETKDVYTGKGWETSAERNLIQQPDGQVSLSTFQNSVETNELEAEITFVGTGRLPKIVYPYGVSSIHVKGESNVSFDESLEAFEASRSGEQISLDSYELTYQYPSFDIQELQESSEQDARFNLEQYTQLPDTLPERVGDLAEEITSAYDSRYDKVRAMERYFSSDGFEYQTTGIPAPGEEEDYVDQFLFDSRIGYCDNFSTAMVVMLRTLDIPARWAKGFTSGDRMDIDLQENSHVNAVTNGNAHSWVEVYFPDVGWVPFEPTQGFTNPTAFHMEYGEENMQAEAEDVETPEQEQENALEEEMTDEENMKEDTTEETASRKEEGTSRISSYVWFGIIALVAISGLILYWKRQQIRIYLTERKLKKQFGETAFQEAYLFLLKILSSKGYQKAADETLREFAQRIDKAYGSKDMAKLTGMYEQMIYRKQLSTEKEEIIQLWKNLINQIMA